MQIASALLHEYNSQTNALHKFLLHGFHIAQPAPAEESGTNHAHSTGTPSIYELSRNKRFIFTNTAWTTNLQLIIHFMNTQPHAYETF
jgi:hypothetical protein